MDEIDYEQIVSAHYEGLYRFAMSLARKADDASELTQETFFRLLSKGSQIRDPEKVKAWLFTTLYRIFVGWKRREIHLPHYEISTVESELPALTPTACDQVDGQTALDALCAIEEHYRAPLVLFYLEDYSYRDIAEALDVPIGTVMSRLSRGKDLLRHLVTAQIAGTTGKVLPLNEAAFGRGR
ncbi:MAG: RNA polymerase sigma factor [Verrucomicrobia bacterium]|nr:RNA polymerase sigma factor [Verrucomicrobiota bacterium]